MFSKILIANRGEIACRVIRTARRMGIRTVAVYSDADRDARHVEMADEAVRIGPPPAAESYLRIDSILEACRASGADAVHPGYGFLSENPRFAEALTRAGIVFIGPNSRAIAAMGDKIESKRAAAAAGVSTVPGFLGTIEDESQAVRIAEQIGFPVMIKASAGGGGKGMRVAHNAAEARDGFVRARSEARASFGDDRVFVEKFITDPRHIEIQVIGDKHGHVVHLGERECSIQRRNQKVVEEAPSPLLDPATRQKMGAQAVALAKAVGYDSAGTVEFVAGQDKSFYFLEMNTRLQVEHPVTELVTGLDLVELMIRVAAGEPLPFGQDDVRLEGWAVESRVYAEDPLRGFLPSIGRLVHYRPPAEGRRGDVTVRNDTGVAEGSEISMFYDPMIAKLVTHAPTRAEAVAAQADALDAFVIDGIQHNVPFLAALMQSPRWQAGRLSTGFIAEEFPEGFHAPAPDPDLARKLAAVAAGLDHVLATRRALSKLLEVCAQEESKRGCAAAAPAISFVSQPAQPCLGRMARGPNPLRRVVRLDGREFRVEVAQEGDSLAIGFPDEAADLRLRSDWRPGRLLWEGEIDGAPAAVQVRPVANGFDLSHRGARVRAEVLPEHVAELAALMPEKLAPDTSRYLLCPMPGLVVSIDVAEGQEVKAGETLCVVEAMKMENALRAERDATVAKINAKPGDSLAVDAVILEFA